MTGAVTMNRAYLSGVIGADVELRSSLSGLPVVRISLAVSNIRKDGDVSIDVPDWYTVSAVGDIAAQLATHGRKGTRLAVEASLRPVKWNDARGNVHREVQMHVERVISLGSVSL